MTVRVEVLLFAALEEAAGRSRLELTVPPDIDIAGFLEAVLAEAPALAELLPHTQVAIDHEFRRSGPLLPAGEIALIPPVSGG